MTRPVTHTDLAHTTIIIASLSSLLKFSKTLSNPSGLNARGKEARLRHSGPSDRFRRNIHNSQERLPVDINVRENSDV